MFIKFLRPRRSKTKGVANGTTLTTTKGVANDHDIII